VSAGDGAEDWGEGHPEIPFADDTLPAEEVDRIGRARAALRAADPAAE